VTVAGEVVGSIAWGLLVFAAVGPDDGPPDLAWMARKLSGLRIFEDAQGKMNLDVRQVDGALLLVSQFTLLADARKGNRPAFNQVMEPAAAQRLLEQLAGLLGASGVPVQTGRFGAHMEVASTNHGPVTILLDSKNSL
jgi:D-tyrosyl-tRNA(Tyr) deacylase